MWCESTIDESVSENWCVSIFLRCMHNWLHSVVYQRALSTYECVIRTFWDNGTVRMPQVRMLFRFIHYYKRIQMDYYIVRFRSCSSVRTIVIGQLVLSHEWLGSGDGWANEKRHRIRNDRPRRPSKDTRKRLQFVVLDWPNALINISLVSCSSVTR